MAIYLNISGCTVLFFKQLTVRKITCKAYFAQALQCVCESVCVCAHTHSGPQNNHTRKLRYREFKKFGK